MSKINNRRTRFALIDGRMHCDLVRTECGRIVETQIVPITTDTLMRTIVDAAPVKLGRIGKRDAAKIKRVLSAIATAHQHAKGHAANSGHWVRDREGFNHIDRLGSLANAIAAFDKMRPAALNKGQALKDAVLTLAWQAYADLEVNGLDNAHFTETAIPVDAAGDPLADSDDEAFIDRWYKPENRTKADDFRDVMAV